jgi:hypothetical protein
VLSFVEAGRVGADHCKNRNDLYKRRSPITASGMENLRLFSICFVI